MKLFKLIAKKRAMYWQKKYLALREAVKKVDEILSDLPNGPSETSIIQRIQLEKRLKFFNCKTEKWEHFSK